MSLGQTFVALSRVRNYKDFLIEPFPRERLEISAKSESLRPRLEEESRLKIVIDETLMGHIDIINSTDNNF